MSNDDHIHEYDEELLDQLEKEDMEKHCSGCPKYDSYYGCTAGGKDNCIYIESNYVEEVSFEDFFDTKEQVKNCKTFFKELNKLSK
jgi:hypothetical protein